MDKLSEQVKLQQMDFRAGQSEVIYFGPKQMYCSNSENKNNGDSNRFWIMLIINMYQKDTKKKLKRLYYENILFSTVFTDEST